MLKEIAFSTMTAMSALSPHPIYFSVTGKAADMTVYEDGKVYEVQWKDDRLSLEEIKSEWFNIKPPNEKWWERIFYGLGCLIPFIFSAVFMILLIISIYQWLFQ